MAAEKMQFPSSSNMDLRFNSCSSPQRSGSLFFSAPTSPTRVHHHDFSETPKITTTNDDGNSEILCTAINTSVSSNYGDAEEEFEFDFSGELERASLSADELFDGGKIKLLKPVPRFSSDYNDPSISMDAQKRALTSAVKELNSDPFAAEKNRVHHKSTRSLSPFRVSDLLFDPEPEGSASFWYKKWRIKDLLLFRSASESHVNDHNQQMKTTTKKNEVKCSSFRSVESNGSVSKRRLSAHELHYTVNRAASEEMKKRTFLPYKQGLLAGCFGFFPTEISKSLG